MGQVGFPEALIELQGRRHLCWSWGKLEAQFQSLCLGVGENVAGQIKHWAGDPCDGSRI